jgi:hypothetical protein
VAVVGTGGLAKPPRGHSACPDLQLALIASQLSEEIQCSVARHLLSLVKSEKNRQVMCEAGMLRTLMTFCPRTLSTGGSDLHSILIRIFEKLGSQAIEPDVLRYCMH